MSAEMDGRARERPFARALRDMCRVKGLSAARIESESQKLVERGNKEARIAKTTVDDLLAGKSWAPTPTTMRALVVAMGLDRPEAKTLYEAAEAAQRERTAARTVVAPVMEKADRADTPEDALIEAANEQPEAVETIDSLNGGTVAAELKWHREHPRIVFATAVGVLVLVIAVIGSLVWVSSSKNAQLSSYGRIATPRSGDEVTSPLDLRGFAQLPAGAEIWILLKAPNNTIYTVTSQPAPVPVGPDGEWSLREVGIGKDSDDVNEEFELILVSTVHGGSIAQAVGARQAGRLSAKFEGLPDDAVMLHSITVTLQGFS